MSQKHERGIALLTVITALVALMIIAVPFAITMRMGYERSTHHNARSRAKNQVDSTLRFLEAYAVRTTERVELENRSNNVKDVDNNDPEVDIASEFTPSLGDMSTALGVPPEQISDAYGTILGWEVDDENGKLNLNSASFFAIGNLMGLSVTTKDLEPNARVIPVEDASLFPDKGYVKIGRELVKYGGKDGNRLVDCDRAVAVGEPQHGKAKKYTRGQWVVNYAAWAVAYYAVGRNPGEFTHFDTLDISDISRLTQLDSDTPVLTQADWERVARHFTVWSKGELAEGWTNTQTVAEGTKLPAKREEYDYFNFDNSYYYNTGTILLLEEDVNRGEDQSDRQKRDQKTWLPRRRDYAMCFDARFVGRDESQLELFGKAHRTFDGFGLRVQTRTRHPVNVNTASRDVLVAVFANLQLRLRPDDRVTPAEAGKVADEIIRLRGDPSTALRSLKDVREMLTRLKSDNVISDFDREAIFRNCINSHDQGLRFGTVPVCFRTFDVYTMRATAQIADLGGRLLAKRSTTRVVEIGSQLTASRMWDTQRDFDEQLSASNAARYWTTGPFNSGQFVAANVQPWPRWQKPIHQKLYPWDPYMREGDREERPFKKETSGIESQSSLNGDARLLPGRMMFDEAEEDQIFVEHFDFERDVNGFNADTGYAVPLDGKIIQAIDNELLRPFSIDFWWKPRVTSNAIAFDIGESTNRNRYACYVDTNSNELVFAVKDNTLAGRNCEIRYDLAKHGGIQAEVWYHIKLIASGCHPSKMAMIVDGRAVGKSTLLSHLQGGLSETDSTVTVEDASKFPPEGAVVIGNEVIEYTSRTDNSLVVRTDNDGNVAGRGKRGTVADSHAEGVPVVVFGGSRTLVTDHRVGGGTLDSDLGPWAVVRMATYVDNEDAFAQYDPPVEPHEPIEINAPDTDAGTLATSLILHTLPAQTGAVSGFTVLPWGLEEKESEKTIEDQLAAFQEKGYAFMIYIGATQAGFDAILDNPDDVKARIELVRYTKSGNDTSGLQIERLEDNGGLQSAPPVDDVFEILVGWQWTGEISTTEPEIRGAPIWFIPISVSTTQVEEGAYINPINEEDIQYWFAQILSQPGGEQAKWEWIRYSEVVNEGGSTYLVQARVPNERLLIDSFWGPDWDKDYVSRISTFTDAVSDEEDPGGDPGGDPDDGGPVDPNDPPTAPPSDGPGGNPDPGGTKPGDPGTGPGDDGPGGNPEPEGEKPGGDDGPGDDGPGGNPEPEGEKPGGDDGPTDDGAGGNDSGEPTPEGGGTEEDGAGGNPIPTGPPEPGPEPPAPPEDEETDDDQDPDEPETESDGKKFIWGANESVANVQRHRGVQSDRDKDTAVDDWQGVGGTTEDGLYTAGAMVNPVCAAYGGPQPADARSGLVTDGEDTTGQNFSIWPMPGDGDDVTLVTGDDSMRAGEDLSVFFAMTAIHHRLRDVEELGGSGQTLPFEFDVFTHLFALDKFVEAEFKADEDVDYRKADQRKNTRLLIFPSGEMPDNIANLSASRIGVRWSGATSPCVIDEVNGDDRNVFFPFTLVEEELSDSAETFSVTSSEGRPNQADVPQGPGVVRLGEELIAFTEASIVGSAMQFSGCTRGVMLTQPRSYARGAPAEIMFGIRMAILTGGTSAASSVMSGDGFRRFPPTGVVRLENAESGTAELRLYTKNEGTQLLMPVNDQGGGIFVGRYGSEGQSFESGTPCFWQPVRYWDRFADSSDDPQLSFWSFSTQLSGALIKRIYWQEGQPAEHVQVRVVARFNEAIQWNATSKNVLFLSRSGGESSSLDSLAAKDQERSARDNPLKFLYAMEKAQADNLINLQADTIECRIFVIYEPGAFVWNDPAAKGWKETPIIQNFGIEYLQQNMVRRNIDR